ncbi:hypothetical protein EI42_03533 [Thermosporothrix hazakensis]|uniref:Uncharacterized protein n=1 Tax=Thermosporothrix hazakensis TaxID=644383 RepID=A0A326U843_THEHA|nr:hypothetical protein EI42_03533 [Thermosporothrix hazakensis]
MQALPFWRIDFSFANIWTCRLRAAAPEEELFGQARSGAVQPHLSTGPMALYRNMALAALSTSKNLFQTGKQRERPGSGFTGQGEGVGIITRGYRQPLPYRI